MNKPNLFLIGAPKCGTTSLYYFLREHPDIYFPELKEPHFFSQELKNRNSNVIYTPQEYRELYINTANKKYKGDASVFYLYSKEAAKNIKFFCPDAKIVCMLRNPIDMIFSMFRFSLKLGAEIETDFEKALALEELRKQGKYVPNSVFLEAMLYYKEIADFVPQLKRYFDIFSPENIHIILYDDFSRNREKVNEQLFDFLKIENCKLNSYNYINKTDDVEFNVSNFLNRAHPKLMYGVRKVLPTVFREKIQFTKTIIKEPNVPEKMDPVVRQKLLDEFAPKINELSKYLNRDLTSWMKN